MTPSQTRIYDVGCAVSLRHGVGWRKDEAADKMAQAMVNRFAVRGTAPVGERVGQFCSYHYHPPWVLVLPFTLCP